MTIDIGRGLLNALLYMGPMAVIGGLVAMYFWEKTCRTNIKVLLVKTAGGVATHMTNKEGDSVHLTNPKTGWSGTWPVNDLATIPLPYPDLAGLLPRFLQREIQTAIFVEGDLEPLLNRSAHRYNVASPNVANALQEALELLPTDTTEGNKLATQIQYILDNTATGPTRELIASPDWVGSLIKSTALKALASVSDDLMEALDGIRKQLSRFAGLNSTYVYIGLVLILILIGVDLYYTIQVSNQIGEAGTGVISPDVLQKIDAIYYNIMEPK
jgi:hypothetical protein